MHRALQNGCGRSAECDRAEHECNCEKDNAGWGETKHDRLTGNQPDHKDSGNGEANCR